MNAASSSSPVPRIHTHLLNAVVQGLRQIFFTGQHAEKEVENLLEAHPKWGARDRRFVADSIYGGVRWWRKLWWVTDKTAIADDNLIREVWAVYWYTQHAVWPDFVDAARAEFLQSRLQAVMPPEVANSIPDWLQSQGLKELGAAWNPLMQAMNAPAPVDLRVNSLRTQAKKLQEELAREDIPTTLLTGCPQGLSLQKRKNLQRHPLYLQGHFEVQDRSSQQIAPLLALKPGQFVVDACAGAGGKSLHIAALLQNRGRVLSMDIHEWKLRELSRRAERSGVKIIETAVNHAGFNFASLQADALLLDVPCSGLGVLRRHPDTKWKLNLQALHDLHKTQSQLLRQCSVAVKSGGRMVYATCSILPSENSQQVQAFLAEQGPQWKLVQELHFNPTLKTENSDSSSGDGFYAAVLQRI